MSQETKVIYHIDDEETPYLVKLPVKPESVTLADFKTVVLNENAENKNSSFKFFFKSKDDDFGVVKEEIFVDSAKVPLFNGRIVAWLVSSAEGSVINGNTNSEVESAHPPPGATRGPGVGQTRPPSFHTNNDETESQLTEDDDDDVFDDSESNITSVSQAARRDRRRELEQRMRRGIHYRNNNRTGTTTETSSMMSSEIESSIYEDTEDAASMASSRFTTSTDHTSVSRNMLRQRQKKKNRRKLPPNHHLERAGSISSVTDSTLSLNIMTVTLNMDTVNFLGISIVGQSNKHGDGDCGIYVGSIMKGGAVALDGRIDPGDMILQVNEINFENMSNDDAVRVLREVVQKPGPIKLVIAKCWDPSPKGYFTIPRTEPVRPIDPGAWVAHTAAVRGLEIPQPPPSFVDGPSSFGGDYAPTYSHLIPHPNVHGEFGGHRAPSVTTLSASSIVSSHPETEKYVPHAASTLPNSHQPPEPLNINSGMNLILRNMSKPDSGLEVRDRLWLKITISKAFIGGEVVDWLFSHVQGFSDRREARKYATQMLKNNFIKSAAVNKSSFSEQCYYIFGNTMINEISDQVNNIRLENNSGSITPINNGGIWLGGTTGLPPPSGPPPPLPAANPSWNETNTTYPPIYNPAAPPPSANYMQLPYGSENSYTTFQQPPSIVSSSGGSSNNRHNKLRLAGSGSGSDSDVAAARPGIDTLQVNNMPMSMRTQENKMIQPTPIYQTQ